MLTIKHIASAGAALGLAAAASAQPVTIYSQTFEGGPAGPEWSGQSIAPRVDENPTFSRFLGRSSGNNGVTLTTPAASSTPAPPAGAVAVAVGGGVAGAVGRGDGQGHAVVPGGAAQEA